MAGWTIVRVAMLWPSGGPLPPLASLLAPPAVAAPLVPRSAASVPRPAVHVVAVPAAIVRVAHHRLTRPSPKPVIAYRETPLAAISNAAIDDPRQPPPLRLPPLGAARDRLAVSAWMIARGGRDDAVAGGQLGASQAGVRLTYAIGARVALAARLSAPLRGRGAEAAFGLDWQPTRAPIHLVAEQRAAIDGGRGGQALYLIGGIDPMPVPLGFSLDAYGQAGAIRRGGTIERFADGAARLARPIAELGPARVHLGAGTWGGAQRGAARLDVGPTLVAVVPVAGHAIRATLDWRERVAGRARPGSGPALSIGGDF